MTWIVRLQHDPSLQAFVSAEIARAGIEVDALRWQRDRDRQCISTLTAQLETARAELRRRRPTGPRLPDLAL